MKNGEPKTENRERKGERSPFCWFSVLGSRFSVLPFFLPVAVVLLFLGRPAFVRAQFGVTEKIKVTLVVILASEDTRQVDPPLLQIAEEVRKLNPQLTRFRLKSMTTRELNENERAAFALPDGKKVEVVVRHGADRENRVGLAVGAARAGRDRLSLDLRQVLPDRHALPDPHARAPHPRAARAAVPGEVGRGMTKSQ
jgi:hypothetical protein